LGSNEIQKSSKTFSKNEFTIIFYIPKT